MFARLALAARDRQCLEEVLVGVPGAAAGPWERLAPVAPDDTRLPQLIGFLSAHRWTELTLATVCRQLLGVANP